MRAPTRLRSSQLLEQAFDGFEALGSPCPALLSGRATLGGTAVGVLAQQKPTLAQLGSGELCNFGMMSAAGYWHALEVVKTFGAARLPIVTIIDTAGADPSRRGSEELLAWSISSSIAALLATPSPTVSLILGEGGSGGALALQVADVRLMLDDATYSVIAPESCSAILHRDGEHIEEALALLRPWAEPVRDIGAIDRIISLPEGASCQDHARAARIVQEELIAALGEACAIDPERRVHHRVERCHAFGGRRADTPKRAAPRRPFSSAQGPPPLRRFAQLGAGSDVFDILQGAFFEAACAVDEGAAGARFVCPPRVGGCGGAFGAERFEAAGWACPACGLGERLDAARWIELLGDADSFEELWPELDISDLAAGPYDTVAYAELRARERERTGASESLRAGLARVGGAPVALAVSEFGFLGGTLGVVAGEKLWRLSDVARHERLPLVVVTCSGGARMQEGTLALLQMAKATAAMMRVMDAGQPTVSVLADPCTGGALGSYATWATTVLAEPHALVAFAGPRVLRNAGLRCDESSLTSEAVAEYGGVDAVVTRRRLRERLGRCLRGSRGAREPTSQARAVRVQMLHRELSRAITSMGAAAAELFDEGEEAERTGVQGASATSVRELADLALISIPALIAHAAESPDPRVRANAIEALARFPTPPRDRMQSALSDPHHRVRANAATVLLTESTEHGDALDVVLRLLLSSDALERRAGLYVVLRRPQPRWLSEVRRLARDIDVHVRATAGAALLALGAADEGEAVLSDVTLEGSALGARVLQRLLPFLPPATAQRFQQQLAKEEAAS